MLAHVADDLISDARTCVFPAKAFKTISTTLEGIESKTSKGWSLIHFDQAKAFDRVDPHFLVFVLAWFSLGLGLLS